MARRNECRVDAEVTVDGRLFHALAAATRNARSPSNDLLVAGALANSMISDAVWAPFERLVEVGRSCRVVPDYVDTCPITNQQNFET